MSTGETRTPAAPQIESISAVTLATHDMARAVRFYSSLGFSIRYGGGSAAFTSFHAGRGYLNLIAAPKDQRWSWWGRVSLYQTWTACTGTPWRKACNPSFPRATRNGASAISTSPTRTAMN